MSDYKRTDCRSSGVSTQQLKVDELERCGFYSTGGQGPDLMQAFRHEKDSPTGFAVFTDIRSAHSLNTSQCLIVNKLI